jgi:DNA-binding NtrC family response regulator
MDENDPVMSAPMHVAIATRDRVYGDSLAAPLTRWGLRVSTLALTASEDHPTLADIHVLVVDIDALGARDLELIDQLHAGSPLVEVVAVTGDLPVEDAVEALRAGFFTVLQHPVADRLLVETILLAGRRHHRACARLAELEDARFAIGDAAGGHDQSAADDPPEEVF